MTAVRFTFGGRPVITARGARALAELLRARRTPGSTQLAAKLSARAEPGERRIADLVLGPAELVELLEVMRDEAVQHNLRSDALFRLRAELEDAVGSG